jgi:hypothetical protein
MDFLNYFIISSIPIIFMYKNNENFKNYTNNVLSYTLWNLEKYNIIFKNNVKKIKILLNKYNKNYDYEYLKDEIDYIKNNKIVHNITNYDNDIINYNYTNIDYDFIVHKLYKNNEQIHIRILNDIKDINNNYKLSSINFIYMDIIIDNNKIIIDNHFVLNIIDNKIFDRDFFKWFLLKFHNIILNEQDYRVTLMDNNINQIILNNTLKNNEHIYIRNDNYIIKKNLNYKMNNLDEYLGDLINDIVDDEDTDEETDEEEDEKDVSEDVSEDVVEDVEEDVAEDVVEDVEEDVVKDVCIDDIIEDILYNVDEVEMDDDWDSCNEKDGGSWCRKGPGHWTRL